MTLDSAIALQLQLIRAMRRVRSLCPSWWPEDRIQEAMSMDSECCRLAIEAEVAWTDIVPSTLNPNMEIPCQP